MADRTTLIIAGCLGAAILLDAALNHSGATIFLMRKLADLVEYLQFWR